MFSPYTFGRSGNNVANHFRAANGIRDAIDRQCRHGFGSVQGNIAPLLDGSGYVYAICFQSLNKAGSVGLGHDDNDGVAVVQNGLDKASVAIHHRSVIWVKRNLMTMCDHCSLVSHMTSQTGTEEDLVVENGLNRGQ